MSLPPRTRDFQICLLHGESGDVDCETVDVWIQNQLPDLIKGCEQKDIFNADKTATGFRSNKFPKTTLSKTAIASLDQGDSKNMKIDVLQAMNFIMMAWQNVLQKTIKNCFALGRFLTPVDVNPIENAKSDHFVPPENWSNLSDVTAFEEFVQCDSELQHVLF
ncbi:hypothetical protein AVEN_26755-1 [Araneus ventricosus]|uniref:DDE-1 domain-containing protein n=1 Tax=Araneus ventricosus TaxID=182803 RepID=A0A4Y2D8C7_ARAVE|nr:hypothetical protein AVEN_26755-1 [Araneus ventricosus]